MTTCTMAACYKTLQVITFISFLSAMLLATPASSNVSETNTMRKLTQWSVSFWWSYQFFNIFSKSTSSDLPIAKWKNKTQRELICKHLWCVRDYRSNTKIQISHHCTPTCKSVSVAGTQIRHTTALMSKIAKDSNVENKSVSHMALSSPKFSKWGEGGYLVSKQCVLFTHH